MSEWKHIGLGDTATFHNGYPFKPTEWSSFGREIIRIQNLTKGSSQTNYFEGKLANKYSVTKGDILISWSGSLGVYEWEKEDAWLNQHLFKVVFDKEAVDKSFFKYLISISLKKLETQVHGATMKHITKKNFDAFPVNLPPLETQQKIAAILDAADTLRQKDKALLAKYDELTQALFLDMFGDPVSNPKGWDLRSFEAMVKFDTKMTKDFDTYGDLLHVGIGNIQKNTGKIIECLTANDEGLTSGKYLFDKRHIIYSKIRPNLNKVALPDFTGLCSADSYPLLPIEGVSNRIFIANILRSECFLDFILQHSTRTNIPKANRTQMKLFVGICPPFELQTQFAERVTIIEQQKAIAQASLEKSEELFNSLLQKAFKGELV